LALCAGFLSTELLRSGSADTYSSAYNTSMLSVMLTQCDNVLFSLALFTILNALNKRWDGHTSHRTHFLETFLGRCDQSHDNSSRCACIAIKQTTRLCGRLGPEPERRRSRFSSSGRHSTSAKMLLKGSAYAQMFCDATGPVTVELGPSLPEPLPA